MTSVYGTVAAPIKVRVTGQVLASTKGKVVMCPPYAVSLVGTVSDEPQTPQCQGGVPTAGIDLAKMSMAGHNSDFRWGNVHVEATWNGRSLQVVTQRRTTSSDSPGFIEEPVTCPAPAGGWKVGGVQDDPGVDKIQGALGSTYGGLAMGYPHGGPTNTDGTNPSYGLQDTEQVVVVGVTGDLAAATKAIRTVFKDNLCVVHSDLTDAEVQKQQSAVDAALDWSKLGVTSITQTQKALGVPGPTEINVIVDTPELEKVLSTIAGPPLRVVPWIQPIT